MDASEQVTILANALSEGINYLAHIRSLRAEPHVASSEELLEWCKALDDCQNSLMASQEGHVGERALVTSPPVSSDLIRVIENVRTHLSTITPGTQLPTSLFDLVDVAWTEVVKAMRPS